MMNIRPISKELAAKAKRELNEDPERINDDLQAIKDWLVKQPHLNVRKDDQWLIAFLRGCKFSLNQTKEKIDTFYTMKTIIPELSVCIDPMDKEIQELLNFGSFLPLPKTNNPDDPRIIIIKPEMTKISPHSFMRLNQMMLNMQMMDDDQSVIAGQIYVIDYSKVNISMLGSIQPLIKKMIISRQNALPIRIKGGHFINVPTGVDTFLSIIKMFLNEKNRNRLYFHGKNLDSLYEYVPKSLLPIEYGGQNGSIQEIIESWKLKVYEYREWFIEDKLYKTNEQKRPGEPKTSDVIFGIEGSFRQLTID